MKTKLKPCNGDCNGELKPIWKREGRLLYCKSCWSKIISGEKVVPILKKQKLIPKQSPRRKKLDITYSILRNQYMKDHPNCEAKLKQCTGKSSECHHLYWGKDRESHMNDFTNVKALCNSCHRITHEKLSAEEAVALGLKKLRN